MNSQDPLKMAKQVCGFIVVDALVGMISFWGLKNISMPFSSLAVEQEVFNRFFL